jgi:carbamoyl-phosphate synthase large subunit
VKVLVTSASQKIPMLSAIREQLRALDADAEVLAGDADPHCLAAYAWPDFWPMPRIDALPVGTFIDQLVERGVAMVIPTRDADVRYVAEHRADLAERGISSLASPLPTVEACLDKFAFATVLAAHGLPAIPTTHDPDDLDGLRDADGTMVVKERFGAGSIGLRLDVSRDEVRAAAAGLAAPVFQPFVVGAELSVDGYRTRTGEVLGTVVRSRDLVIAGESQVTTTREAPDIAALAADVMDALGIEGHAVVQVIAGPDGPRVVECNARLGGASTLSLAVGLRSLAWFALEARGDDPHALPFEPVTHPLRLVRIPQDVIRDPRL